MAENEFYKGGSSDCEPFTVDKGNLTIVTLHPQRRTRRQSRTPRMWPLGPVVHDTAHVTGQVTGFAPNLSKVVLFAFYNTIDCTGERQLVAGNNSEPTTTHTRSAFWGHSGTRCRVVTRSRARFAGDANYNPVLGSDVTCEPLTVDKAQPPADRHAHPQRSATATSPKTRMWRSARSCMTRRPVTGQVPGFPI